MTTALESDVSRERPVLQTVEWLPFCIVALALALRVLWLGIKPAHFDEGVNGWFVDSITREGFYHYDPSNFHGPLHFYVLFVAQTLLGRAEWVLRLPIALISTASVALLFSFRQFVGRPVVAVAALAMAISPGMVFYGRYAIHESWLLFFLLLTFRGILGVWRDGTVGALRCVVFGVTGMILTKETYAIHVIALLLAWPTLRICERFTPSARAPFERQTWTWRELGVASLLSAGLIVFFYTGAFLDWPDFKREPGAVGSLAGLWECFHIWGHTGTGGLTGHEKPWAYWLELLARYEWPGAAGLLLGGTLLIPGSNRYLRFITIAGLGTLTAYSIIDYKTPWCLIVMVWPLFFSFAYAITEGIRFLDRWTFTVIGGFLVAGSLMVSLRLNFQNYADESEPYVYVQTLPDINKLLKPLRLLARISPANYHLTGHILLAESDSHPLPWLLGDFPEVDFLDEKQPPEQIDADFLVVEDDIVSSVEDRLEQSYYKQEFILRGGWGNSATLYLKAQVFAPFMSARLPDFTPAPSAEPAASDKSDKSDAP